MPYTVQLQRLDSVPLAVIRRQARAEELARVVPECCGLVWNAVRAQQVQAGRHVAIYWDGRIRLEVGVELYGPFVEHGEVVRSATPAGSVASATHFGPYASLGAAHEAIRHGVWPTITAVPAPTGRSTVTGSASGTPIPREFARTSTISSQRMPTANILAACAGVRPSPPLLRFVVAFASMRCVRLANF
jgi:hypothetical protein